MTYVNILYDESYDDIDIIMIPDDIVSSIQNIAQEFLDWIPPVNENGGWVRTNNKLCLVKETMGFVEWLNSNYCMEEKAYIVKKNVPYCESNLTIEF